MTVIRRALASLAVLIALAATGATPVAAAAPPATLSAEDRADLARVEQYLDSVRTLKARFVQTTDTGRQATGTFYLSRPGRMRLEYDAPVRDFVVADGLFLFYWDSEMKQQSSTPIGSTLADFILRKDLTLSGDITVTGVQRMPGAIEVSVVETKDPGKGTLTLVFEDKPLRLRKWRVLDAQGTTTEVALQGAQVGIPLDKDLFYFVEPVRGQEHRH